jgi:hypothetical protein
MRALASWIFLHFVAFAEVAASAAEPAMAAAPQFEIAIPDGVTGVADVICSTPPGIRPPRRVDVRGYNVE